MDLHGGAPAGKRRVVVVADQGRESAGALQWTLSHAILEHDDLVLLHVEPASARRTTGTLSTLLRRPGPAIGAASLGHVDSGFGGEHEFLEAMRAACEAAQPKVRVQIERVEMEGKDKAAAVLAQAKVLHADLLVIGQRRTSNSFFGSKSSKGTDIAEFLIENSKCLCVAVQKKGQNMGYLLNTKTHKNFWLLA